MRVAIGGFVHESNSFSKEATNQEMFENYIWVHKDRLIEEHRNNRRVLGGYVDYAEEKGWEIVPLISANALPAGPVVKSVYEHIKHEMTENLKGQAVDGVLLHLHGAAVAEGYDDCEGDLLASIRAVVGKGTPILVVHDLHANVSDLMVENSDGVFGYNTQPHIDMYEREMEAAETFEKIVGGKLHPVCVRVQPPILLPAIATDSDHGPMRKMLERAFAWETKEKVINVSPFAGFYGSDKVETGTSVVVMTDGDRDLAAEIGRDMADLFWQIKEEFFVPMVELAAAAKRAKKEGGLWAFIDEADDPLGGGPGDGTYILQGLLDNGIDCGGVSAIHDPAMVEKAYAAGKGGTVSGRLGAWKDQRHGAPVKIDAARVAGLYAEKIPVADWDESVLQDTGRMAALDVGGIFVIVTEHKAATENIDIFRYFGIDVATLNVIVLKGLGHAYKNVFKDLPKEYVTIDSIGITNPDVTKLGEFTKIRRPIYPLDPDTVFPGK